METRTIRIRVSARAARVYEAASAAERRTLDALLDLRLSEAAAPRRPLEDVMDEMSRQAQARGLTPDLLDDLLGPDAPDA